MSDYNDDINPTDLNEYTDQYGIVTLSFNSDGYLWICLENDYFRATSNGVEIPMVYVKESGDLHCYVSAEKINAGTIKFAIEGIHPIKSDTERLIITARSYTITYGDALPDFGYTANGEVEGTPAITCEAVSGSDAGTYAVHIARGTVTDDNAIYVDGVLTIEKAVLTITADDKFVEQNGQMPTFTVQYSGFVNGEDETDLTTQPTCTTNAVDTSTSGQYTITPSGAASDNYSFAYVDGVLSIGVSVLLSWTSAQLFAGKSIGGFIKTDTQKKGTSTIYWGVVFCVKGLQGNTIRFTRAAEKNFIRFAFMKSCDNWNNNTSVDYSSADGFTAQVQVNAETYETVIPADTNFVYVYTTNTESTNRNFAPGVEIMGTPISSKTIFLAASLFTANKTIGNDGTVYTGQYAPTVWCTTNRIGVDIYTMLYNLSVDAVNVPVQFDTLDAAFALYTATGEFIERIAYNGLPRSIDLDPSACSFHLMMVGRINGTAQNISSVPISDNDVQLVVIDN